MNRRQFLRRSAASPAIAAASASTSAQNIITESQFTKLKWSKAPCRFCRTGCGVRVAVKDNRVVATHADAKADVNRGLNCVKRSFGCVRAVGPQHGGDASHPVVTRR